MLPIDEVLTITLPTDLQFIYALGKPSRSPSLATAAPYGAPPAHCWAQDLFQLQRDARN